MADPRLSEWLARFGELHERAKKNALDEVQMKAYLDGRRELESALLTAEQVNLKPGETARRSLRVALALPVELELPSGQRLSSLTLDVSGGGLSALLPEALPLGARVKFTLKIGRGMDPVHGAGKVVNVFVKQPGSCRTSLMFEALPPAESYRLGFVIVDVVLRQWRGAAKLQ